MARIKFGPLITEISGSVGGSTFQRSTYGPVLRNKPIPLKSSTDNQLLIRQYMKNAHAGWTAMTSAERRHWQGFTSYTGNKVKKTNHPFMSGHNLYIKYQVMRQVAGLAIQDTLQYIAFPTWFYPDWLIYEDPLIYVHFADVGFEEPWNNVFGIFKVSSPRPESQRFNPRGVRYCAMIGPTYDESLIQADYIAYFGAAPPIGSFVHYYYQAASTLTPIFSNLRKGVLEVKAL